MLQPIINANSRAVYIPVYPILSNVVEKPTVSETPGVTQRQQFGTSHIKVENQQIDTGTLHTKESARELAMASHAKVEHAPTSEKGSAPTNCATPAEKPETSAQVEHSNKLQEMMKVNNFKVSIMLHH